MRFPIASLLQLVVILVLKSVTDVQVEAAVGLHGPDRYEGLPDICRMPMDFGYCRAKVQRYYFDIRRMKCTMFFWGGCAGNENNFKTLEECNDYCTSPYEEIDNSEVVVTRERTESRVDTNVKENAVTSSVPKSVPKFALKSKETGYKGPFKANARSINVNTAAKPSSDNNDDNDSGNPTAVTEEEEYDE